jgi:hypothetical protein
MRVRLMRHFRGNCEILHKLLDWDGLSFARTKDGVNFSNEDSIMFVKTSIALAIIVASFCSSTVAAPRHGGP